jgi:hypothetical protein
MNKYIKYGIIFFLLGLVILILYLTKKHSTDPVPKPKPKKCAKECKNEGKCIKGKCECKTGWEGSTCETKVNCQNGHITDDDKCSCNEGWGGVTCDTRLCSQTCINGKCTGEKCNCNPGWGGVNCNTSTCKDTCEKGNCDKNNKCVCTPNWEGINCSNKVFEKNAVLIGASSFNTHTVKECQDKARGQKKEYYSTALQENGYWYWCWTASEGTTKPSSVATTYKWV